MTATKRLYQPNLTCSFDICLTDDNIMWTLSMKNHDDIGITDDQFIEHLWQFVNTYTNTMVKQNLFVLEDEIPETAAIVTHNMRYTMYNIIIQAEAPLTQSKFIVVLGELCKNLAGQANVELKGLKQKEQNNVANP